MQWATGGAFVATLAATASACVARRPCDGVSCSATCPREAARDPAGRCACSPGNLTLLGACVPPAVADAYCGPAARYGGNGANGANGASGCAFRSCSEGTVLDAATGVCLSKSAVVVAGAALCGETTTAIVAQGRSFCVPKEAACPRGTDRDGALCAGRPVCPAGSLADRSVCRPIVEDGRRGDLPRVDLGAWAAIVLGADGGSGTPDLCRPLSMRPDVFGPIQSGSSALSLRIVLYAPDQDLTRAYARVALTRLGGEQQGERTPAASRALSAEAESLALAFVSTLVEPLRGLGGEASAAIVEVSVSCAAGP